MSISFSAGFHLLKPGMRVSGQEISVVFVNTYDSGIYAGKKYINIDLVNEPNLTFVEAGVAGPLETVADPDALYTQLDDAGMTEAFPGFLVDPTNISIIEANASKITFDFAGNQPYIFNRSTDPAETERIKTANQTWIIPQTDFDAALTLFLNLQTPTGEQLQQLQDLIDGLEDGYDFTGRITAPATDNIVPFLYADQAAFPSAADWHGALAHSHADGAFYFAHAGTWHKLANDADLLTTVAALDAEVIARTNADTTLQGNIDVVSAGLATEITDRTAGDTATLSSANTYTDTQITNLVDGAGPALDTLKELGDALEDNDDEIAALVTSLANETTARTAGDAALSGRLDTLEADPTTATALAAVQADVNQNETDSDAADAALSGRLDTLEADPTTATAVAAVQADVDQNEADGDAADAALSGRLDTLEADPTTATAVAAVQADVDQNEADGDAADAALSGRLDVLEADPTTATAVAAVQSDVDQNEADADAALALRPLLDGSNIPGPYANDAAAATGGVAVGALYKHDNGQVHYRVS